MNKSKFIVRNGMQYRLTPVKTTESKLLANGVCYPCAFRNDAETCMTTGSDCLTEVDSFWKRVRLVKVYEQ